MNRLQLVGMLGLLGASIALLLGQVLHVYYGSVSDGPRDGWVQLLPWAVAVALFVTALFVGARLRLGLMAAGVVVLLRLAVPLLVTLLPGQDNTHAIWTTKFPDPEWVASIADGSAFAIRAGDLLMWFAALATLGFTVVTVLGLRDLLLARASTASFSLDMTVLIVVFFLVTVSSFGSVVFGNYFTSLGDLATASSLWLQVLLLIWLIPLTLWLALTSRQGGAIALGSASGLVAAMLVIPVAMNLLVDVVFDGSSGRIVFSSGEIGSDVSSYELLDRVGILPAAAGIAVVMLIICLWWGLSTHTGERPSRPRATTASPVNSLSVVAFILAWFPFTAIPAVVLGHMAYDHVVDGPTAQRGIGLSRWAIVLGYVSAVAAVALSYNIWLA